MMTPSSNSSFKEIFGLFVPRKRFAGSSNLIPSHVKFAYLSDPFNTRPRPVTDFSITTTDADDGG